MFVPNHFWDWGSSPGRKSIEKVFMSVRGSYLWAFGLFLRSEAWQIFLFGWNRNSGCCQWGHRGHRWRHCRHWTTIWICRRRDEINRMIGWPVWTSATAPTPRSSRLSPEVEVKAFNEVAVCPICPLYPTASFGEPTLSQSGDLVSGRSTKKAGALI